MNPGDIIIIYAGRHYGRLHKIVKIERPLLIATQVDTGELVTALICDCEVAFPIGVEQ